MEIILTCLFLLILSKYVLQWVSVWQLKEYRLDRMLVHIKETQQGRQLILSYTNLCLLFLFCAYVPVVLFENVVGYFNLMVITFGIVQLGIIAKQVATHSIKRPVFTVKALGIFLLSELFLLVLLVNPLAEAGLWVILVSFFLPFIIGLFVFFFSFPTELYTDMLIERARKKMQTLSKIKVIAVSGSYGKSSTKEIVTAVLSEKYNVIKTPLSQNTPIAIAKTILEKVTNDTDFFVVEMGAYKRGEIAQLCFMALPHISITTAVSDQHISLYGSLDNVIASELELVSALPKNGIAIFNRNNPFIRKMAEKVRVKKIWYEVRKDAPAKPTAIIASNISYSPNGTLSTISYKEKRISIMSPLLGKHTIENILPGVLLGFLFDISEQKIKHATAHLTPLPKTMVKITLPKRIIGIDDSFNASPESVAAALVYLNLFVQKKHLVLTPLIELGTYAKKRHEELAKKILHSGVHDVFLTNNNFYSVFEEVLSEKGITLYTAPSYEKLAKKLRQKIQTGDVVLFEGKEAGIVLKYL